MLTVLQSLQLSTEYLDKKGIESARLNAELLLAEILQCRRLDLYLKFDQPLKEIEIEKYREWISRRGKFEPLQYIIGKVEFYGLQFKVSQDVLIPRPETEILVEEVMKYCKFKESLKILDIGTGSGNIPIALAANMSNAYVIGIDISEKAISTAQENAVDNGVVEKVNFIKADIRDYQNGFKFDILISNPPYVSKREYDTLQKEIVNYEPTNAVTDLNDGLGFYRTITDRANNLLKKGGKIFLELGKEQAKDIAEMFSKDFSDIYFVRDYQQIDRVIVGELK